MHYLYRISLIKLQPDQNKSTGLITTVVAESSEQAVDKAYTKLLKDPERGARDEWTVSDITEHPISAALYRAYMETEK